MKPANVMITPSGDVKVMDFGIARARLRRPARDDPDRRRHRHRAVPLARSRRAASSVDARSDVYSTGCVLFELLTGQPPFTGDSPVAVAYQHVREDPRPPSELNPAVPPALDAIVLKALAKNPFNRYQTAGEMRDDLIRALQGEPVDAPLVMSEDERTDYMNQTGPTQAVGPAALRRGGPRPRRATSPPGRPSRSEVRRSRRRRRNAIIGGIVLVAAVLGGLFWLTSPSNRQFAIPDVTNQPQDVALRTLTGAGLRPNLVQVASDPAQVGRVLGTDPGAGTQVQPDTVVALRVGRGPDRVPTPAARRADRRPGPADGAGGRADPHPGAPEPPGRRPVAGREGPRPGPGRRRPRSPRAPRSSSPWARRARRCACPTSPARTRRPRHRPSRASGSTSPRPRSTAAGRPARSSPPRRRAGSTVAQGSKVTLSVSKGNQLQVPSIIGKSQAEPSPRWPRPASRGNLQTNPTDVDDPNQDGKILSQSPTAGSQAGAKDTITVTVGRYNGGGAGAGNGGGVFGRQRRASSVGAAATAGCSGCCGR